MAGNTRGVDRRLLALVFAATALGVGHHVDYVVRGNHVGWPVTSAVNAFTDSLAIYPIVGVGFYLTVRDRVGAGYWVVVSGLGLAMLGVVHLGPWAIEPPSDVIDPHDPTVLGYLAFALVLALLGSLLVATVYAYRQWRRVEVAWADSTEVVSYRLDCHGS